MSVCIFGKAVNSDCLAVERLSAGPSQMQVLLEFCRICPRREHFQPVREPVGKTQPVTTEGARLAAPP